ncbi:hypothetical protein HO173_000053 [Letharia columbiana]|uniref:Uncharacterized protein n=1 Tax=Letharia columbiana TaxID=112416 RepID=A0A8H6G678_9LECA|nr:uncharacterized protein HO173_000053 [Letharia columbiana]KAF6241343.1 hypothetical protein HO173_000053 [Letharia columbiana]
MPVVQSQCPDGEVALNTLLETQSSGQAKTSPSAEEDSVGSVISSDDKSFVVYSMYAARASFVAGASNSKNGREGYKSGHYIIICAQLSYPLSRGNVSGSSCPSSSIPRNASTTEPLASLLKPQSLRKPDFAAGRRDLKAAEENLGRTVLGRGTL